MRGKSEVPSLAAATQLAAQQMAGKTDFGDKNAGLRLSAYEESLPVPRSFNGAEPTEEDENLLEALIAGGLQIVEAKSALCAAPGFPAD